MSPNPASPRPDSPSDTVEPLVLTAIAGPLLGQTRRLDGHATLIVGRGPTGVQWALAGDSGISGTHFLVEYNPPRARVVDLRSKNGTWLNGVKVSESPLKTGDEIRAGQTLLKVEMPTTDSGTMSLVDESPVTIPHTAPLMPGYSLLDEIGRGGMGIVYRARRETDGAIVALKTILTAVSPQHNTLGRFQREMSILQSLTHPNIVRFLDTGESGNFLFFVMEYIDGISAASAVKTSGTFAPARAIRLTAQLLEALAHAHLQGFIHRDVKPGNLLLTTIDGVETVKLADFGLARTYLASAMSGLTISGQAGGTPGFMPPEQVLDFRTARPAADQYAAAATLYFLLTGQMIYEPARSSADLMLRVINDEPIPIRQPTGGTPLPGRLGPVICRALSRDPAARYPDVLAFRDALLKAMS